MLVACVQMLTGKSDTHIEINYYELLVPLYLTYEKQIAIHTKIIYE